MKPPPIILADLDCRHQGHVALRHVSGRFAPGSLTAVVGPNGAGKSTLLAALAGLHPPAGGRIDRGGLRPAEIALLPQRGGADRGFPLSCGELVQSGALARLGAFRAAPRDLAARAGRALAAVGLEGFAARPIGRLSAGQFQRVQFARLMLHDAPVILLDEPIAAVDAATTEDLLAIIAGWHREGRTVIAVLHDLDLVRRHFPQALVLAREVRAWGPTEAALAAGRVRLAA